MLYSKRSFEAQIRIAEALIANLTGVGASDVQGAAYIGGQPLSPDVTVPLLQTCLVAEELDHGLPNNSLPAGAQRIEAESKALCGQVLAILGAFVSADFGGALLLLTPHIDPQNRDGGPWLKHLRELLHTLGEQEDMQIEVLGMSTYTWDAVWAVQELFPEQVGVTTAVVLLFVALAFRSFAGNSFFLFIFFFRC